MSSLQWTSSVQGGTTVVELAGYLNDAAIEQFDGAVGWTLAAGSGPVVLDLGELQGWSRQGEHAVVKAASRVIGQGRSFVLCRSAHLGTRTAPWIDVEVFTTLAEAMASLQPPAGTGENDAG